MLPFTHPETIAAWFIPNYKDKSLHYAAIMEECVTEVSSREEKYSIHGPVLNYRNFWVLVKQIIHSWDGLSQNQNISKFSTESECKTAIAALKVFPVIFKTSLPGREVFY